MRGAWLSTGRCGGQKPRVLIKCDFLSKVATDLRAAGRWMVKVVGERGETGVNDRDWGRVIWLKESRKKS